MLIDKITLMPEKGAQNGLQAEMHLRSGALLGSSSEDEPVVVPC